MKIKTPIRALFPRHSIGKAGDAPLDRRGLVGAQTPEKTRTDPACMCTASKGKAFVLRFSRTQKAL